MSPSPPPARATSRSCRVSKCVRACARGGRWAGAACAARLVNDKRTDADTGERMRFSSAILPPWARKTPQTSEMLPLYLHGLSSGTSRLRWAQLLGSSSHRQRSVVSCSPGAVRNEDRGTRLQAFISGGAGVVELDVVVGHQVVFDQGQGRELLAGMLGGGVVEHEDRAALVSLEEEVPDEALAAQLGYALAFGSQVRLDVLAGHVTDGQYLHRASFRCPGNCLFCRMVSWSAGVAAAHRI